MTRHLGKSTVGGSVDRGSSPCSDPVCYFVQVPSLPQVLLTLGEKEGGDPSSPSDSWILQGEAGRSDAAGLRVSRCRSCEQTHSPRSVVKALCRGALGAVTARSQVATVSPLRCVCCVEAGLRGIGWSSPRR